MPSRATLGASRHDAVGVDHRQLEELSGGPGSRYSTDVVLRWTAIDYWDIYLYKINVYDHYIWAAFTIATTVAIYTTIQPPIFV